MSPLIRKGAVLSDCGAYRYVLGRYWDGGEGVANFVMLNPSTADATADDPTIRRCTAYARAWGMRGLVVTNLFAYRATDPAAMQAAADPVGDANDGYITTCATSSAVVVLAWGARGGHRGRDRQVLDLLHGLGIAPACLARTRAGHPGHPLYLPGTATPIPYIR